MKTQSSLKKSPVKAPAEAVVKGIRRQTRRHFSAEDKIRIVLDGLRGEYSIAELCRKEGIAQSLYYTWSKGSWKPASAARPATPPVPRPPAKCRTCGAKPAP